MLRQKSEQNGLQLDNQIQDFIKDHQFRYPQKAETQQLPLPNIALKLTEQAIVQIYERIGRDHFRQEIALRTQDSK